MKFNKGRVSFTSDDPILDRAFYWAKATALSYVREGDPVGEWYEAALPGRDAFCMRDVAHQVIGGYILGLDSHSKNMLRQFALGLSQERDYCSYWEIDWRGTPAPVDFTSNRDFWYNLPANFDVLRACWRAWLWSGDRDYIDSSVFNTFYDATVTDYIRTWDKNGDGIPERQESGSRRGIPTYDEGEGLEDVRALSDLIAAQAAAFDAYAEINRLKGNQGLTKIYHARAAALRREYERSWWDESSQRYFTVLDGDGSYRYSSGSELPVLPLFFGLVGDHAKLQSQIMQMDRGEPNVELMSYMPEVFYRYGADEQAYSWLLRLTAPGLHRREYPEVSFGALDAFITGMMGIEPRADRWQIRTMPHLPARTGTVEIDQLPVFDGWIRLKHEGNTRSTLTNRTNHKVTWQAAFSEPGMNESRNILVDGKPRDNAPITRPNGQAVMAVETVLEPGQSVTAEIMV